MHSYVFISYDFVNLSIPNTYYQTTLQYFRVADALELWDGRGTIPTANGGETTINIKNRIIQSNNQSTVRARTITEEYATDSYQNLLFSICRFHEVTHTYPKKISMVSFTFKQTRFENLHANAIHYPLSNFHYVGVDPPSSTGFNLDESSEGERTNSLVPYQTDPYGCHTKVLQQKRIERNPFVRMPPYELTCPEMKDILSWCGPDMIPKSSVPWG